jgi:flagellar basal-body rod protein FlgB
MNNKALMGLIQAWSALKIYIILSTVASFRTNPSPEIGMLDKMTGIIDFNAQALSLRAERQKFLASNIANADTPHYKAVDFNFAQALSQAATIAGNSRKTASTATPPITSSRHLAIAQAFGDSAVRLQYRQASQPSMDANTVDMDVEQAKFADNTVRYEASLRFLNGQIRTILSAISGQG